MATAPDSGRLTKDSVVSIGLVTVLLGTFVSAALWVTGQVSDVQTLLLPKMARIESDVGAIARDMAEFKAWKGTLPSASDIQLLIDRAIREHSDIAGKDMAPRLEILEAKINRLERDGK